MTIGENRLAYRARALAAGALMTVFTVCAGTDGAHAIEVACIEASKYKYLYQIFGNDRRKFAEYFQVDAMQLPNPEACRAIVLSGRIEPHRRDDAKTDFDKLYGIIAASRGWLSTVYLDSGGGNISSGLRLAQLIRMFWLKTYTVEHHTIDYIPDFLAPGGPGESNASSRAADTPPELLAGWRAYLQSADKSRNVTLEKTGRGRCASACTFLHVAGIDRRGVAYYHRGHSSRPRKDAMPAAERSMADIQESLQRSELRVLDLYRQMDGGDEIIKLFKETSTLTVSPAVIPRFPRYIWDLLRTRCRGDVLAPPPDRRHQIEQCVAAAHEKERLQQYAKHCAGGCDRSAVLRVVTAKLRQLAPETQTDTRPSPRREAEEPRRR